MASIFKDGRFSSNTGNSSTSYFQNITCSTAESFSSLSNCILADSCQSTCENAIGLKCFGKPLSLEVYIIIRFTGTISTPI